MWYDQLLWWDDLVKNGISVTAFEVKTAFWTLHDNCANSSCWGRSCDTTENTGAATKWTLWSNTNATGCKAVEQRRCTEREQWWTPCFSLSETVVRNLLSVLTGGNNSLMVLHVFVKAQWFTAAWFLQTEIKTMLAQPKRLKRRTV